MTQSEFSEQHKKALAYLTSEHPDFETLSAKLNLGENKAFAALITDIYVNTSHTTGNKETSCLLLDRFVSLLSQLAGGHHADENTTVEELS